MRTLACLSLVINETLADGDCLKSLLYENVLKRTQQQSR